jgi:hypothetical protein
MEELGVEKTKVGLGKLVLISSIEHLVRANMSDRSPSCSLRASRVTRPPRLRHPRRRSSRMRWQVRMELREGRKPYGDHHVSHRRSVGQGQELDSWSREPCSAEGDTDGINQLGCMYQQLILGGLNFFFVPVAAVRPAPQP